ncbi:MAG TPA: glycosyl hydrolase family 26 [Lentisphaeria bacterium]|nr:MAG: hypothetical protein A2X45_19200 [Lentisphaerae bacterium GWF2_50_93]HCE44466.1 glycosyl hydrolase family 26 [Lentisphaeria bacterium]
MLNFKNDFNSRPVNPRSSYEARQLLDLLYRIKGKKIISAQHDFITSETRYCDLARQKTGSTPLIWGSDLSFFFEGNNPAAQRHSGPMNLIDPGLHITSDDFAFSSRSINSLNRALINVEKMENIVVQGREPHEIRVSLIERIKHQHRRGHIITLMWHNLLPGKNDRGYYEDLWMPGGISQKAWDELVTKGTALHGQWLKEVDAIAIYLEMLCAEHIPVLWRPYHEMNGVWFWWCNKPGGKGFQRLWIHLYERLVLDHGLDNLLWVWNANAPRNTSGDEAYAYSDFYPGSEYVDVLATDVYRRDYSQTHYDELVALADGKPVALGEVGELPPDQTFEQQPEWTWIMPWGNLGHLYNTDDELKAFYARNNVITLENRFKSGFFEDAT